MNTKLLHFPFYIFCSIVLLASCEKILPGEPFANELLDGPVDGLTTEQSIRFLSGDVAFNDEVFTAAKGLGPMFVSTSCGSCHAGDGKGTPFTTLTRFGQTNHTGNQFLHLGGPQLQHRAIPGYEPEKIPNGATFTKLTPPANTGLGFLDFVSDADILAMADPEDANGDSISGVPNWINIPNYVQIRVGAILQNGKHIGRFGKKANAYDLLQQTAMAYNQDIGITSTFEPFDTYTGLENDPEVSNRTIQDVVFYLQTLKAPLTRNEGSQEFVKGKQLFMELKCGACHVPELRTGNAPIAALAHKTFAAYTDLLLHDMGSGLDDGYTEGSAKTSEWRTPALWGLGLSKNSQGGQLFLLHDGRARSLEEAILLHGGEAQSSKENYQKLSAADRGNLIKFLESL